MRKLIVVAHISADGFVAGPKGEFDNFTGTVFLNYGINK